MMCLSERLLLQLHVQEAPRSGRVPAGAGRSRRFKRAAPELRKSTASLGVQAEFAEEADTCKKLPGAVGCLGRCNSMSRVIRVRRPPCCSRIPPCWVRTGQHYLPACRISLLQSFLRRTYGPAHRSFVLSSCIQHSIASALAKFSPEIMFLRCFSQIIKLFVFR